MITARLAQIKLELKRAELHKETTPTVRKFIQKALDQLKTVIDEATR